MLSIAVLLVVILTVPVATLPHTAKYATPTIISAITTPSASARLAGWSLMSASTLSDASLQSRWPMPLPVSSVTVSTTSWYHREDVPAGQATSRVVAIVQLFVEMG